MCPNAHAWCCMQDHRSRQLCGQLKHKHGRMTASHFVQSTQPRRQHDSCSELSQADECTAQEVIHGSGGGSTLHQAWAPMHYGMMCVRYMHTCCNGACWLQGVPLLWHPAVHLYVQRRSVLTNACLLVGPIFFCSECMRAKG